MPRPGEGVNFGRGRHWLALAKDAALREAGLSDLPAHIRVRAAAVAHADRVGHARFGPGGLGHVIGASSSAAVSKAIRRAIDLGLVHSSSRASCVVLDHRDWQSGLAKGEVRCVVHDPPDPFP